MFSLILGCILLVTCLLSLLGSTLTMEEDETLSKIGYVSEYILVISFILLFALVILTIISE